MCCLGEAVVSTGMQLWLQEEKKECKDMQLIINHRDACAQHSKRTILLTPYFSYKFVHEVPEKGNNNLK